MFIDKLAWIHIVGRRILSTRTRGRDTFYIPGGKRESGETEHQTLIREIKEELAVDLLPGQLSLVGVFEAQAHGAAEGVVVRMTCYQGPYAGALQASGEIDEIAWLTHVDRTRSSPVDRLILDWLRERDLIDA